MSEIPLDGSVTLVGPSYNIYRYTDQIYKIVHFPHPRVLVKIDGIDRTRKGNEEKLDPSISRAKRVVLEYALCNRWEWFCTFTLDQKKYDRFNLHKWYEDFTQWIRDERKRTKKRTGRTIQYLLIPELHKDGAWHMHGMFSGIDDADLTPFSDLRAKGWYVPDYLIKCGFRCWERYHKKFGYCSLGAIRSPVASGFYIMKYMTKSINNPSISVGSHSYYNSHGLNRSSLHADIYGESDYLNSFISQKYQFCETGMTHVDDGLDWMFALSEGRIISMEQVDYSPQDDGVVKDEFDYAFDAFQEMIEGFEEAGNA